MSMPQKPKLSDAVTPPPTDETTLTEGPPNTLPQTVAEQTAMDEHARVSRNGVESNRDHMVNIGRGTQQAGRQGQ